MNEREGIELVSQMNEEDESRERGKERRGGTNDVSVGVLQTSRLPHLTTRRAREISYYADRTRQVADETLPGS